MRESLVELRTRLLFYMPYHTLHHFAGISLRMWAWLINLCTFLYMETPFSNSGFTTVTYNSIIIVWETVLGWYLNWSRNFPSSFHTPLTLLVLLSNAGMTGKVVWWLFLLIIFIVVLSPLPLNLLSEMAQHLIGLSLTELISALHLHLQFIRHALTHPQINPVVSSNQTFLETPLFSVVS